MLSSTRTGLGPKGKAAPAQIAKKRRGWINAGQLALQLKERWAAYIILIDRCFAERSNWC